MAEFTFNCPRCGQSVEADESFCGQTVECPRCGKGIVVPSIKSSFVSKEKTQALYCPNCGNACEVDGELAIGQHLICPFCAEKFVYSGTEQGSGSLPQDDHAEERRNEEITAKCPHCGTLYEVEQSNLGQEVTCETCGKNFVLVDVKTSVSDSCTEMTAQESVEEGTEGKETVTPLAKVKTLVTTARNKTIIWWKNGKEGREAFCSNLKAIAVTKKNKTVRLWKWTQVGGVGGYVVTGRDDFAAKSIFLPASGFGGGTKRHLFGERGFCGSSSPDSVYSDRAWCLIFDSGKRSISCNGRTYGFSVRPVQDAVKWFRKVAEQGDVEAQFGLGVCYSGGDGVAKDTVEAVKWYRKAAELGFASAQCKLGLCYAKGDGVEKDQATAVSWYRKAANQGHAEAQNLLGVCYSDGKGVAKDKSEAAKWYRKAAEQGNGAAIYNLTTDNDVERVKWFRKAGRSWR